MEYYYTNLHERKVRIDIDNDEAFAREKGGEEYRLEDHTKVEADAVLGDKKLSKEEYESDEGFD